MVLLGPYFEIPQRNAPSPGTLDVDNIGTSLDSFYRAADQLEELHDYVVDNNWRVYYAAIPGFDNTAGKFDKNGAVKRKTHLLELTAAIAAFMFGEKESKPGFFQTSLKDRNFIGWTDIPKGNELKKTAEDFLKLVGVVASGLYPALDAKPQKIRNDGYLKQYFKKNPADEMEMVENMRDELKVWLQNMTPYFEFWQEIQLNTHLGMKDSNIIANFFPKDDMNQLAGFLDFSKQTETSPKLPLLGDLRWMRFIENIKPDKKRLLDMKEAKDKLEWMFEDIWNICHKEG